MSNKMTAMTPYIKREKEDSFVKVIVRIIIITIIDIQLNA